MTMWTMIAIVVVAGCATEIAKHYFKRTSVSDEGMSRIKEVINSQNKEIEALKKRIRNLEAIAATSPDEFRGTSMQDADEFDHESEEEFNEKLINQLARKKSRG